MSRYLIRRIEENPAIELRTRTELVALEGRPSSRTRPLARTRRRAIEDAATSRHVFVMTGAVPNTGWLDGCVALDDERLHQDGADLSPEDLAAGALAARRGRRTCSRRACRACSRSATSRAATSSGSRPPSARARSPSPSSTRCCTSRRDTEANVIDARTSNFTRTDRAGPICPTPPQHHIGRVDRRGRCCSSRLRRRHFVVHSGAGHATGRRPRAPRPPPPLTASPSLGGSRRCDHASAARCRATRCVRTLVQRSAPRVPR